MEIRLARLEGAYEQIDSRLADLRQDLDRHFGSIDRRFAGIDQRFASVEQRFAGIDQKLTWIVGLIVTTWTTTILTILVHR